MQQAVTAFLNPLQRAGQGVKGKGGWGEEDQEGPCRPEDQGQGLLQGADLRVRLPGRGLRGVLVLADPGTAGAGVGCACSEEDTCVTTFSMAHIPSVYSACAALLHLPLPSFCLNDTIATQELAPRTAVESQSSNASKSACLDFRLFR